MKYIGLIIVSFLYSLAVSAQTPLTEAVDFTAKDVYGVQHHLFDILDNQQQYVLIDFFSVTCGPCQEMAPIMDSIYHEFGSNESGLFVMAIDQTFDNEMVLEFEQEYNTHYPAISGIEGGGAGIYEDYQIPYYPSLILIAPNHQIVEQAILVPETTSELRELLESYGLITIGLSEIEKQASIAVFPNPATDVIYIDMNQKGSIQEMKIYSSLGEEMMCKTITAMPENSIAVDISFLEQGFYLISVENANGQSLTKSFIKN